MSYVCEHSVGPARTCDFRSGKVILQQAIEPAQMSKLLLEGRTDLLPGFISNRTRRAFKAYLVRNPDGKVGFEFQKGPAGGDKKTSAGADKKAQSAADKKAAEAAQADESADSARPAAATKTPAARKAAATPARKTAARKA